MENNFAIYKEVNWQTQRTVQ